MAFPLTVVVSVAGLFVGMLLVSRWGRRLAIARLGDGLAAGKMAGNAAEAAVFGLLGLLIAFTFSGAAARFDERRHLIATETNAIGTAYLRLDLLPADSQPEIRDLFRRYVEVRATVYRSATDDLQTSRRMAETDALQREIWGKALAAALRPDTPLQATLLMAPALNDMIDITTTRAAATAIHPPFAIYILLGCLCLVGAMLVGQGSASDTRPWFYPVIFAAILSATLYVIFDIEYPRLGFIRVDAADQILLDLRRSMQ